MSPASEPLAHLRAKLAAQLAARLAAPDAPLAELRELQERLKLFDTALAEQRTHSERRLGALLWPPALIGGVLLLAATVPVPSVPLSLTLKASAATLDLAQPTVLGPLPLDGEVRIEGFSSLASVDASLAQAATRAQADRLAVRAAESSLHALRLPARTRLVVQAVRDKTTLQIESPRAPLVAELQLRGATWLRLGDAVPEPPRDYAHGEWVSLVSGDAAQPEHAPPPMTLWLPRRGDSVPKLQGLRPVALRFAERRDGGAAMSAVGSSIEGGTLALPATGQTLPLVAGDWLEIDGLVTERFELVAGTPLTVQLNGSARGLRLRTGEFEQSLKPSWLEYMSRHHRAQLLWGSAAVLWGALAWMRRHFAGWHA